MDKTLELNDKRVLLIDDQKPFQVMLKGLLLNLGAKDVQIKTTGEAGIGAATRRLFDEAFFPPCFALSFNACLQASHVVKRCI